MVESVDVCLTSCGRLDLLKKTLYSFFNNNTYNINDFFIYEDYNDNSVELVEWVEENYNTIKIYTDNKRIGQRAAIDFMYSKSTANYIYHCEDDWEFYNKSFIEDSLDILKTNDEILQVHNRHKTDLNGHPISSIKNENNTYDLVIDYMGVWSGFSFNPGLRRKKDYNIIGNYSSFTYEHEISIKYKELGYRAVVIDGQGYVRHIGYGHHVYDPTNGV